MAPIIKKRFKAYLIDVGIASAAIVGVEYILRKKIKSEVVYGVINPLVVPLVLEYAQLKRRGQTFGYRKMGLKLESSIDSELTSKQIIRRIFHSQITSQFKFLANPISFSRGKAGGGILPHDSKAHTIVSEVE